MSDQRFLDTAIGRLAQRGVTRRFARGVILIQEGDEGGALYIVLSGQIKVFVQGDDGREFVLGLFEAGDYVGEMSLDGGPRSASVMTTQATRCSVVSRAVLTDYLKDYPEDERRPADPMGGKQDRTKRLKLMRLCVELAESDAHVAEGESIVLSAALEHWGLRREMLGSQDKN